MSRNIKNYPPVGSPDRLDEIMSRGAGMRRRRRMVGAASASLTGIAALVLVVALGSGIQPTPRNVSTASGGSNGATRTTEQAPDPTTTAPTTTAPAEDAPFLSFDLDDTVGELRITINDPAMPVPADPATVEGSELGARQCVLVTATRVDGDTDDPFAAAEGFACREVDPSDGAPTLPTPIELRDATDTGVGCAAIDERFDDPIEIAASSQTTEFVMSTDLPAGSYELTMTGVSGFGDGCPGGGDGDDVQVENVDRLTTTVTIG